MIILLESLAIRREHAKGKPMPSPLSQDASTPLRCLPLPRDTRGFPDTHRALLPAVTSSAHRLSSDGRSLWVNGQDVSHHAADPCASKFAACLGLSDRPARNSILDDSTPLLTCLEDSWSGHALAWMLRGTPPGTPVTLLHLDDHMDLGPTLLARTPSGALLDPMRRCSFDATDPEDWIGAIGSGAVNIGNWLTATLLGLMTRSGAGPVAVHHLVPPGNAHILLGHSAIMAVPLCYGVLPDHTFIGVERRDADAGTHQYLATQDIGAAFSLQSEGLIILHIDLDVFANDFNGGYTACAPYRLSSAAWQSAVLSAIGHVRGHLAGIVVATSPGFCAAWRWRGLLASIQRALGVPVSRAR